MSQIIVGLDIGTTEVKAVWLKRKFSGVDLYDSKLVMLNTEFDFEERIKSCLGDMLIGRKGGDSLVVSLPGDLYSVRSLEFPFDDSKKIAQVLPFEVESHLPFSADEVIVDHYIVKKEPDNTEVLVAAILKSELEKFLNLFKSIGIDPTAISIAPFALFNYCSFFMEFTDENIIVVDVGRLSTIILQIQNGKLKTLRTLSIGADSAGSLEKDEQQVVGYEGVSSYDEDENQLSREICLTVRSFLPESVNEVPEIYLDGLHVEGLQNSLEVRLASPKLDNNNKKVSFSVKENFHVSCGLALSQVLMEKGANLNFRKGEFSDKSDTSEYKKNFISVLIALLLLLSGGLADLYVRSYNVSQNSLELSGQIRELFLNTVPQTGKIVDEVHQIKVIMDEYKRKKKILGSHTSRVITILSRLSENITPVIDVREMNMEGASLSILAITGSFEDVDTIQKALSRVTGFNEVKVSDAKVAAIEGKIKFKLIINMTESL